MQIEEESKPNISIAVGVTSGISQLIISMHIRDVA